MGKKGFDVKTKNIEKNNNVFPRLILQTELIILLYHLGFTSNQEKMWGVSSSSINSKNAVVEDQTHDH